MSEEQVDFSIVIPVYFNEGSLDATFTTIKQQVIDSNPDLQAETGSWLILKIPQLRPHDSRPPSTASAPSCPPADGACSP